MVKYAYDIMDRVTNISRETTSGESLGGFGYDAAEKGLVARTDPDKPMSPRQEYKLACDPFELPWNIRSFMIIALILLAVVGVLMSHGFYIDYDSSFALFYAALSFTVIAFNYLCFAISKRKARSVPYIPVLGGVYGYAAVRLVWADAPLALCVVPLSLDPSTWVAGHAVLRILVGCSLVRNIVVAREACRITRQREYRCGDKTIRLPYVDYKMVEYRSSQCFSVAGQSEAAKIEPSDRRCLFEVVDGDSYSVASNFRKPLVMNFANAHVPGGGFLIGGDAQEESLCRASTLYASISSPASRKMYRKNNFLPRPTEWNGLLYSENVAVFRNYDGQLLESPFLVSVASVPAPNRRGLASFASRNAIKRAMRERIAIMMQTARAHGHKDVVVGAWGCGAFGNNPEDVADCYLSILNCEAVKGQFDHVVFAIKGNKLLLDVFSGLVEKLNVKK